MTVFVPDHIKTQPFTVQFRKETQTQTPCVSGHSWQYEFTVTPNPELHPSLVRQINPEQTLKRLWDAPEISSKDFELDVTVGYGECSFDIGARLKYSSKRRMESTSTWRAFGNYVAEVKRVLGPPKQLAETLQQLLSDSVDWLQVINAARVAEWSSQRLQYTVPQQAQALRARLLSPGGFDMQGRLAALRDEFAEYAMARAQEMRQFSMSDPELDHFDLTEQQRGAIAEYVTQKTQEVSLRVPELSACFDLRTLLADTHV